MQRPLTLTAWLALTLTLTPAAAQSIPTGTPAAPPAEAPLHNRVHAVADLLSADGKKGVEGTRLAGAVEQLLQLITRNVAPQSWAVAGGNGQVRFDPATRSLVVTQTPEAQEEVAELLTALRNLQARGRVAQKLEKAVSVRFQDVPLGQALDRLKELTGVNIVADVAALREAGVDLHRRVRLSLDGVAAKTVLNTLLRPAGLRCVADVDSVVVLPEEKAAPGRLARVVYPVADLVIPVSDHRDRLLTAKQAEAQAHKVMQLIRFSVAPETWDDRGGPGAIAYRPSDYSLVVLHTPEVAEKVGELLALLSRQQERQAAVATRIIEVSEDLAHELYRGLAPKTTAGKDGEDPTILLDDQSVFLLLALAQRDRRSSVLAAPKITVLDGQPAKISVMDTQFFTTSVKPEVAEGGVRLAAQREAVACGLQMNLLPVIAPDDRSVTLRLEVKSTSLAGPVPFVPFPVEVSFEDGDTAKAEEPLCLACPDVQTLTVEKTLTIPTGRTALLNLGTRLVETREDHGIPLLSSVPYVNRLFRNVGVGREARAILVLVTPRVLTTPCEATQPQTSECREACPAK